MHMDAAEFGAAMQGRKHFSGIEQALRVEGAFQPLLLVEIDLREHLAHEIALLDPDAVLAGQNAAEFDAAAQNVGAKSFSALHFAGLVGVVKDQRMQIAVAGVKYIGDPQTVFRRKITDARQCFRQFAARNGAVHAEIIRRNPPDRWECRLAPGPEQIALNFRIRNPAHVEPQPCAIASTRLINSSTLTLGPSSSMISNASTSSG